MKQVKDLSVTASQLLLDTAALLQTQHTTGAYCRDQSGDEVIADANTGCTFCTLGGVYRKALDGGLLAAVSGSNRLVATIMYSCPEVMELLEVFYGYILKEYPEEFSTYTVPSGPKPTCVASWYSSAIIAFNDNHPKTLPADRVQKMMSDLVGQIVYADIKLFLKKWLEWAEAGGEGDLFDNSRGLCHSYLSAEWEEERLIDKTALRSLLVREFGQNDYPFGGKDQYALEHLEDTTHKNEARLAWVRRQLEG